jgi:pantetheine-phosphate adenylyltransferase
MKTAIYPGTFDPVTNGHLDLVERGLKVFDRVIISVSASPEKKCLFTHDERVELIKEAVRDRSNIVVDAFDSLLVDYVKSIGGVAIIRGLRAVSDFEYELQLALMNRKLEREIETVFMTPSLRYIFLSSTIVKEAASYGGSVEGLVPENVERALRERLNR